MRSPLRIVRVLILIGLSSSALQAKEPVFFVKGWLGRPETFAYLQQRLQQEGYRCVTLDLEPTNGTVSIRELGKQMAEQIEREAKGEPFSVVAFSMGGLVARSYLTQGGAARCRTFIAISSPHQGSWLAQLSHLAPLESVEEMRGDSDFLSELAAKDGALANVRCFDYQTPFDFVVAPSCYQPWPAARLREFAVPIHYLMVFDSTVREAMADDLAGRSPRIPRPRHRSLSQRKTVRPTAHSLIE